ncbi:tetratricopeptide repeat protein [Candidatus Amarolinea dominans]|uniref:tetratricopeptide repeat protein n=1 Tax=Candidatus Amarolinea dominans TaxID=3140696 RepID=UPI00313535BA|nr:tetratricopeptide repeat protein [Anaerolineae bacterium]
MIELATTKEVADSLPEAYRIMASVALSHGEFDDAIDWAIQARSLAVAQSNLPENGAAERLWGQALHLAGNAQGALSHLELGLQIWERIGDCFEIAQCRRLLALAKSDLGDDATAWRLVLQALTDLVKLPAKGDLAAMRAGGPMKFILTGAPNKVVATCLARCWLGGWARASFRYPAVT